VFAADRTAEEEDLGLDAGFWERMELLVSLLRLREPPDLDEIRDP
jgi:hypothetical protein